jgi:hypothetical protein
LSFYEPADQHPFLTGTAVSVRNTIVSDEHLQAKQT